MKIMGALAVVALLAACGADGTPGKPQISATQTIGMNSNSGVFTDTEIGIHIPLN